MCHRLIPFMLLLLAPAALLSQNEPTDGLRSRSPSVHALTNARIIVSAGTVIERGTLIVRGGRVEAIGPNASVPPDARLWNLSGLTITPGFIDLSSNIGMPKREAERRNVGDPTQDNTPAGPVDWNQKILAHVSAAGLFTPDEKSAAALRSQGFVLALTHAEDGIFSGSPALVSLGAGTGRQLVMEARLGQYVSLERAGSFLSGYPNSLMGIIAHIRQTLYDADWYGRAREAYRKNPLGTERPETNLSLDALNASVTRKRPFLFASGDELNLLRSAKIAKEFGLNAWIDGSGKEFRRLDAVRATHLPVIVPVRFPDAPAVASPEEAAEVSLEELREWDAAPENPGRLDRAGVSIALTARGLKTPGSFLAQVRTAIRRGLSGESALRALTETPARMLDLTKTHGTLEKGKVASFIVSKGDVFDEKSTVREVWVTGTRYEVDAAPDTDARGVWAVALPGDTATLDLKGEEKKVTGTLKTRRGSFTLTGVTLEAGRIAFSVRSDTAASVKTIHQYSGTVAENSMWGIRHSTDPSEVGGPSMVWKAIRTSPPADSALNKEGNKTEMASFGDVYPLGAFGRSSIPPQPGVLLIKNATVWTMGPQGRLDRADILVENGKISMVGPGLRAPRDAEIIDATNMHVTPGLFDAHSHVAVSGGVNEGGQSITSEVRIADVLDPDNIWIYRQLAGGTIGANILHGSANPIGGQNAVVKWRWGSAPDDLLIDKAPQGVKFALGENVKRSHFTVQGRPARYPKTRMGVEQLIADRFQAAREYEQTWKRWLRLKEGLPPRKDLELDAIVEMLNGSRLIHAHSYRQDEILMLIRVAEEFGIRIATFQHILEGYKVADAIAKHGAGGSGFSDWWSYKWEAYDAIPGNIPLMHQQGVLVSYNSDNAQLATRLNWEAAKGLEYGMSEEEALATVTINVAKQLGTDSFMGSIEPKKEADLVIWNGNPLSTGSKCVQTWVDGRRYFDIEEDAHLRQVAEIERSQLIQKILADKKSSSPASGTQRAMRRPNEEYLESCTTGDNHE